MQLQAASEITLYLLHRARHLLSVKSAVHYEVPIQESHNERCLKSQLTASY